LNNNQIRYQRLKKARLLGTHSTEQWEALKAKFAYRCVRCGASDRIIQRDHIVPIYQGGSDGIENIQPLCQRCNASKGPETFNWAAYRLTHGFPE